MFRSWVIDALSRWERTVDPSTPVPGPLLYAFVACCTIEHYTGDLPG